MRLHGLAVVGIVLGSSFALTGCGHDCGSGTVESNGECVVVEVTCSSGTTLVDGRCVAGVTGCGPQTRLDAATGRCVPSSSVCGSGTSLDESTGECVPNSEVRCGTGTIQVGTVCVVEPSILCPEGQVDPGTGCVPGGFVQIVHNSPDPAAADVGIYVDGTRFTYTVGTLTNDRVAYRTATRFLPIAAGNVHVVVTAPDATDDSAPLTDVTVPVSAGSRSVLVVGGVVAPADFTGSVAPLSITEVSPAFATSDDADPAGTFRLGLFQGAPDAGVLTFVSFLEGFSTTAGYGSLGGYGVFNAGIVAFDVQAGGTELSAVQTSSASSTLSNGFDAGNAAFALTSGFVNAQASAPDRTFAVVAALPEGGVLRVFDLAARVQIAHAAADAGGVDVFINHVLRLTNAAFGSAVPMVAVPAGVDFSVAVAATGDPETAAVISQQSTLASGSAVAYIVTSASAGAGPTSSQRLAVVPAVASTASTTSFSAAFVNAIANAGSLAVRDANGGAVGAATPVAFAEFTAYTELNAGTAPLDLYSVSADDTRLASFQTSGGAILSTTGLAAGQGVIIVATGVSPDIALRVLLPNGIFEALERAVRVQFINAVQARDAQSVDLLVNGTPLQTSWPFRSATAYKTYARVNGSLAVSVQPAGDSSLRVTRNVDFTGVDGDLVYVMTLLGARANAGTNDLYVYATPGREVSTNVAAVDVNNFNGLSDLSPFDVNNAASGALLFDDADYGTYGRNGFISLPPASYQLQLSDPDSDPPFIQYFAISADLSSLAGKSMVLLETGFNVPGASEPAFGAIGVLADGTVLSFPTL